MIKFEYFKKENYEDLLEMMMDFYRSEAVTEPLDKSLIERLLEDILSKKHPIWGYEAIYDDILVGFGIVTKYYASEVAGPTLQLEDLYIREAYRSKGIAKKYFAKVKADFPNVKRLRLEVCSSNKKAIKLYKKLGFEVLDYIQMVDDQV